VINQTLAHRYFPNGNAIGQQIRTPLLTLESEEPGRLVGTPDTAGWLQIVGVVADSLNDGLDQPVQPALYAPYPRFMWMGTQFLVRTQGKPLSSFHGIQSAILAVNPDQQIGQNVRDLTQWIEERSEFKQQRLFSILFGLFSGLALALALAGLYSVVSYSVTKRTNEFGIRMALGAQRAHILWIVCRNVGIAVSSGLLVGLLIFGAFHNLLAHWTQNSYSNPLILAAVAVLFILCAAAACIVPARRAASIDPMQAIRYE
jgi:ABC-type antimicrobial peptide transport system permease subunit